MRSAGGAVLRLLRLGGGGSGASAGRKPGTLWPPWGPRRRLFSSGPPWRLLFFGSDHFAVETLKALAAESRAGGAVSSLEVATLSADVPVAELARREGLPLHRWPLGDVGGRFDVGVVISFGCLLHQSLIEKFPYGILNVHPSLLPRWRGPAPIFHTVLNGDAVTAVTIMQIRPHRFDVGPILNQSVHAVPEGSTADELADVLAAEAAPLLVDTLRNLPQKMADKREQSPTGATYAPKINASMSWIVWEEQTCRQIECLYRAIGSRIPLRSTWMGRTIRLVGFAGTCHISFAGRSRRPPPSLCRRASCLCSSGLSIVFCFFSDASVERSPGSVSFRKESNTLAVRCKVTRVSFRHDAGGHLKGTACACVRSCVFVCLQDGWVSFKAVIVKKRLTAADFYNGYLHRTARSHGAAAAFVSPRRAPTGETPRCHAHKCTTGVS
ncbi:methionyl-tRNA formyltransferase, mitochondrial isoform X2 [Festucalex cinctus]